MRNLLFCPIFLLTAALLAASCSRGHHADLDRIDSLLSASRVDTAAAGRLIDSLRPLADNFSESDRMRYDLLTVDWQNKSYRPLSNDSLIRIVADYYDREGTPNERMRAYYLLGSVYRDLQSPIQAQRAFHKAANMADTTATDCNYKLLARIYGQLGELYIYRTDYRMSLRMLQQAEKCGRLANDSLFWISCAFAQCNCYRRIGELDSILSISQRSHDLFLAVGDTVRAADTWLSMAEIYISKRNFDQAARSFKQFEQESGMVDDHYNVVPGRSRETYYTHKGDYYWNKGQPDSALIFYYKNLRSDNANYKEGACQDLAMAYEKLGCPDSVYKYNGLYNRYKNMADRLNAATQLQELQTHFDINRERQQTATYKKRSHFWTYVGWSSCGALMIAIGLLIYFQRKSKKKIRLHQEAYKGLSALLEAKNDLLVQLQNSEAGKTKTIVQLQTDIGNLKKDIGHYRDWLLSHTDVTLEDLNDLNTTIVSKLHETAATGKAVTENSPLWADLYRHMTDKAPHLIELMINHELNDKEQRICMLIWSDFTPKEVSILLAVSKQNVSTIRSRLLDKIYDKSGSSQDFDALIRQIDRQ